MTKSYTIPLLLAATIFLSGCFALADPQESSGAVSAPTLAAAELAAEPAAQEPEQEAAAPPATEVPATAEAYPAEEAPPTTAVPEAYPPEGETAVEPQPPEPPQEYPAVDDAGSENSAEESAENAEGQGTGTAVYEIDPARSQARFTINEVLRGTPTTVVGATNNLGGQIALDLDDPGSAQVGTILINARDITTDNDFRNNAIANKILLTNDHEFITFEPTSTGGLPESAVIGETYNVQITGDLTITGQTREVTFDTQVTPLSETELAGLAALDILYADFGLAIPFARSVESVEDNVLLELEFIAVTQ